jgi:hypothetical protein
LFQTKPFKALFAVMDAAGATVQFIVILLAAGLAGHVADYLFASWPDWAVIIVMMLGVVIYQLSKVQK